MRSSFSFLGCFLLVTIVQVFIFALGMEFGGTWFVRILYWPVQLLSDVFIHAKSEADVMAGIVFVPPVVLVYSLAFTLVAAAVAKRHGT